MNLKRVLSKTCCLLEKNEDREATLLLPADFLQHIPGSAKLSSNANGCR